MMTTQVTRKEENVVRKERTLRCAQDDKSKEQPQVLRLAALAQDDSKSAAGAGKSGGRRGVGLNWPVIAAFFAIYVIWGSTFLAIRTAVLLVPPWFCAGVRFFTAGVVLYGYARLTGTKGPTGREWRSLAVLGLLMFAVTYGALFWAEQYVPSGITSVLEALIPLFTMGIEVFVLRQQRFKPRVLVAVVVGFAGVAVMLLKTGGQSFGVVPCLVVMLAGLAWSLGAVLTGVKAGRWAITAAGLAGADIGGADDDWRRGAAGGFGRCGRDASVPGDSGEGGVGAGVFDHCGIAGGVYGVCVSAGEDAGEPGSESCVCESAGGAGAGVFSGRRGDHRADAGGGGAGGGKRGADAVSRFRKATWRNPKRPP